MSTRRQAFGLAGLLTATALTGMLAVAGIAHHPAARPPTPVVQVSTPSSVTPASTAPNWADD